MGIVIHHMHALHKSNLQNNHLSYIILLLLCVKQQKKLKIAYWQNCRRFSDINVTSIIITAKDPATWYHHCLLLCHHTSRSYQGTLKSCW